jgi:cyclophilin family peptidyl-prolyl cis-trans isomerase
VVQGGDVTAGNGTGGCSAFGRFFRDEKVWLPHANAGLLSLANFGPDTNNSQFIVTLKKASFLDGKNTVIGRVIKGMDVIV